MARLEDLKRGASLKGILPDVLVTVVDAKWHGSNVVELTYKDALGRPHNELLYRDREQSIDVVSAGRPWSFDSDGEMFRLVSEAHRIRLAYLFDPLLAVHTSLVDPLPHQITAVYEEMLTRQPLRYLLADDPGTGKTIMTGLLLKELAARGDLRRCLICCPGMLAEQWQDELYQKFHLDFDIVTREMMETARSGNIFNERNFLICRLDQLSRNEDVQAKLAITSWDIVVCDEAHKIVMLSLFLSAVLTQTWSAFAPILLDDPVTHFDDLNAYSFLDVIRGLIEKPGEGHQFILSTCEERLYRLMRQKFAKLPAKVIYYEFESIGEDGPVVKEA